MKDLIKEMILHILTNGATIDPHWLQFSADFGASYSVVGAFIRSLWNYLAIIGVGMTLIYFLIEINQKLAVEGAQNMTLKSFMSPFLKLAMAVIILANGANITLSVINLNDTFVNYANTSLASLGAAPAAVNPADPAASLDTDQAALNTALSDAIDDLGLIELIVFALPLLLCYIASVGISVIWMYKAITYKLEVLYRIGITPVALADVYSGSHSNAFRWLKGFLALGLYGMAIIILPRLGILMSGGVIAGMLHSGIGVFALARILFISLCAPFAALGVASTVKQMCKEALA